VHKLIPARNGLAAAYRLFKRGVAIRKLVETELAKPDGIRVPANLDKQVRAYLADHSDVPWDAAVARIAGWTEH